MPNLCFVSADGMNRGKLSFSESLNLNDSQIGFFTVNTGRHKKRSFAAVFSYKQNNQQFICQRLKPVNNAG
jgi:hypothetical protein